MICPFCATDHDGWKTTACAVPVHMIPSVAPFAVVETVVDPRGVALRQRDVEIVALRQRVAAMTARVAEAERERDEIARNADRIFGAACERLDVHGAPGVALSERIDGLAGERDEAIREGDALNVSTGELREEADPLRRQRDEARAALAASEARELDLRQDLATLRDHVVGLWHQDSIPTTLHGALGMTWEEYAAWVKGRGVLAGPKATP